MTDIFYGIGDMFQFTFHYVEKLGNIPNVTIIAIGTIAMVIWIRQMAKYNKQAEENNTLK